MPNPLLALGGASILSGVVGGRQQANAAEGASQAQYAATMAQIEEQRRQFNKVQQLLGPFVRGGTDAFRGAMALSGAFGAKQEQRAINRLMRGPQYQTALQQGQESILSQGSATGGLRGGNTQAALGELAPNILNQVIANRYNQLGGLAQMGQSSAAGVGSAAQAMGNNVSAALQQGGAAQAGGILGQAAGTNTMLSGINSGLGTILGSGNLTPPAGAGILSQWGF
jgi:hypothetical protein